MKKIVIFGAGKISYAISQYILTWGKYEIGGYVVDGSYVGSGVFLGKPLLDIDEIQRNYPPSSYAAFVAMGYQSLNALRREKVKAVSALGYELVSIVNPAAPSDLKVGGNCFVGSGELIQPGVVCGDNVFVWNGALVGHHTELSDHCWVTGGAAIGGCVKVGANTFIGIGATIGHEISIGLDCMIGAGTLTSKNINDGSVLISKDTEIYRLNSEQFIRMSSCFRRS